MAWALWDDENDVLLSVVQELPESIRDKPVDQLADLGYHELVVTHPEDYIPRFRGLLGSATFTFRDDGKVEQTWPEADFSVEAVRNEIQHEVRRSAHLALVQTDWYFIRKLETGEDVPEDVKTVRSRIRAHQIEVENEVAALDERALLEYRWYWPTSIDQTMQNGVPVSYRTEPPPPREGDIRPIHDDKPAPEPPPVPSAPITEATHNPDHDPTIPVGPNPIYTGGVEPMYLPPTTDGPVEHRFDPTLGPDPTAEQTPRQHR